MTKVCVIIPARFASSRFPGKPLKKLLGVPMVIRVARKAALAVGIENVFIATEEPLIASCAVSFGFKPIITSPGCLTGTDRVAEASKELKEYDLFVNVQGDEPLVSPADIVHCIESKIKYPDKVVNGFTSIAVDENPESVNIPKVIFTEKGELVYASRALIPSSKRVLPSTEYKKQVCIYVFDSEQLNLFYDFGRKGHLEQIEDIEILRFFEVGQKVFMASCTPGSVAVDVPSDIPLAEARIMEAERNEVI